MFVLQIGGGNLPRYQFTPAFKAGEVELLL